MGTYPIDQCETVVVLNQTKCNPDTPQQPVSQQPISQPPVSSPRPGPPPRPTPPVTQAPTAEVEEGSNIGKNVVIALAVLVGTAILGVGAFILYKRWKQRQQIEMIGEYVTEDIFDSDDDEELVTLEPQPGFRGV